MTLQRQLTEDMTVREQIASILRFLLSEIETGHTDWVEDFIKTLKYEDIASEQSRSMTIKKDDVEQFTVTLTLSKGDCDEESDYEYEEYEDDDDYSGVIISFEEEGDLWVSPL